MIYTDPVNLLQIGKQAIEQADKYLAHTHETVRGLITDGESIKSDLVETHQYAVHGFAWMAAYVEALHAMHDWGEQLEEEKRFSELEQLIYQSALGSYLSQLINGIAMSQDEIIRPVDLDVGDAAVSLSSQAEVQEFTHSGNNIDTRIEIVKLATTGLQTGHFGNIGEDEETTIIRDQFRRFADESIAPHAQDWHLNDELIPMEVIEQLADLGVFGICLPEDYDGMGLGKVALCVVTEELSRAYIGVGSLGTRSEIAGELILKNGTEDQRKRYLSDLATGKCIPTAVFTEPNTGSDLGSLDTRANLDGEEYKISGNKTWITHAARADLMTVLARTDKSTKSYDGLSMFLVDKPRANEETDFPLDGLSGGEIPVLGYRGMKEYELGFEELSVSADALLGGKEGQGFKQLMSTFESARIQTAARAVGVAQNALELGFNYALERKQFGKALINFPRIAGKIGWMITELMIVRQLAYRAARRVDSGQRTDIEAGISKLLAARCAWSCADNALQIHGGNGYAQEYPISRVLCDARILNIFEGAAEIQAQVIGRGLLSGRN